MTSPASKAPSHTVPRPSSVALSIINDRAMEQSTVALDCLQFIKVSSVAHTAMAAGALLMQA